MSKLRKFQEDRSRYNYDTKLMQESQKMNEMEQMIMEMETQENQLLERLKNSQQME